MNEREARKEGTKNEQNMNEMRSGGEKHQYPKG